MSAEGEKTEGETAEGETDPWKAFSVGGEAGNPAYMNVGNKSMRMNNSDGTWKRLQIVAQAHNVMKRIVASPFIPNHIIAK